MTTYDRNGSVQHLHRTFTLIPLNYSHLFVMILFAMGCKSIIQVGGKSLPLRHFHHMPANIDYYTHSLFTTMLLDNGKG